MRRRVWHWSRGRFSPEDLKFLGSIGESWHKLSIRDERLEAYTALAEAEQEKRDEAIKNLISAEMNPRIRHRLTLLDRILTEGFMSPERRPDRVVIEFAREEFMGQKSDRKKALMDFQNERREERLRARETLGADAGEKAILKHQLYEEQGKRCLFCGKNFSNPQTTSVTQGELSFENAHLAHIVADSRGGPRAYMNLVLACNACNTAQHNLHHATAFAQNRFPRGWDAFVEDVRACSRMRPFKKKLLTTKNETEAADMVQNRTALQQTAWIAKLARTLICLKFGWPLDFEGQAKRIVVVTGAVTNRVGQRYQLYRLLGSPGRIEEIENSISVQIEKVSGLRAAGAVPREIKKARKELSDLQREIEAKCRSDKRHHALDAMILPFLPHWAGDPGKNLYFGLPKGRNWHEFFKPYIDGMNAEELRFEKPVLRETIYGLTSA